MPLDITTINDQGKKKVYVTESIIRVLMQVQAHS